MKRVDQYVKDHGTYPYPIDAWNHRHPSINPHNKNSFTNVSRYGNYKKDHK